MTIHEFCISYNTPCFETTIEFYTEILDFVPSVTWDRSDGKGAFMVAGGNGVVEIFGAPEGEEPYLPPPPGSFMVVIMVDNVNDYKARILSNGGIVKWPMEETDWGCYFGIEDPNQVEIYFMQRIGENVSIAANAIKESKRRAGAT